MTRYRVPSKAVKALGFKSGLEMIVNSQLVNSGVAFAYEGTLNKIKYFKPITYHTYLGDFLLENGIIIETKGRLTTENRKKHKYIKEQHPDLDIRFLFSNANNKLHKDRQTRYRDWCDKQGFMWANKIIPQAWLYEVKPKAELNKIINILKEMNS